MSGIVTNNVARVSGTIAATPGGLDWSTAVVTASTLTASAGNGYYINTTSNACTITLPSSAEAGDQIVFVDYARTWATNAITLDSNGLNFQGNADTYTVDYDTAGQSLNIVYSDSTQGWLPISDDAVEELGVYPPTQKAIFYNGEASSLTNVSNLVNSSGVVGSDVTGVGTARQYLAGAGYGEDKAIFGYGNTGSAVSVTNLVNNSGVIGSDVSGVGTARIGIAAATYGRDKAIFGYGEASGNQSMTNLVNSSGVVASDVTGVGTARTETAAVGYGGDKAIFGYGYASGYKSLTNLVNNLGVVASDTTGVGTGRSKSNAASYDGDKAIFAFGWTGSNTAVSNLVSNSGVVATDVSGVGTTRSGLGAASYGGDKAIFAYGYTAGAGNGMGSMSNLVNSSGVIASDVTGVGTARAGIAAAGYSTSA